MITSYVSPEGTLLYLSLVGPLDRSAKGDLAAEFDDRVRAGTRRCILDLTGAESCDAAGLGLVGELAVRAEQRTMRFSVSAGNSPVAEAVRSQAGDAWLDVLPELPMSA